MKKVFLSLFVIFAAILPSYAAVWSAEERVSAVGSRIISANSLPSNITFKVVNGAADNSKAIAANTVQVSAADLAYTGNDNEVAYIAAYELGNIINNNIRKKKDNKNSDNVNAADIMGIDLMINGGYNPLAGIVVLTKMPDSNLKTVQNKPANSDRAMYIYDYLSYNFPSKIKIGYSCNEYRAFLTYAGTILECRNSDKKKLAKFNKEQAKHKSKRAKQLAKYKSTSELAKWDVSYELLQSITEPENTANVR